MKTGISRISKRDWYLNRGMQRSDYFRRQRKNGGWMYFRDWYYFK